MKCLNIVDSCECLLLNSLDDSETPLLSSAPSSNAITDVGETVILPEQLFRSNVIAGDGNDVVSEEGSSKTAVKTEVPATVTGAAWGGPVYSAAIEYFISLGELVSGE